MGEAGRSSVAASADAGPAAFVVALREEQSGLHVEDGNATRGTEDVSTAGDERRDEDRVATGGRNRG